MYTQPPSANRPVPRPIASAGFALAAVGFLSMGRTAIDSAAGRELDGDTIAIAAFATSAAVTCLALCAAFAQRAPLREAFALHRPRASLATLLVYAGGLLGLSIVTKFLVLASGAYEDSGLEALDAALLPDGPAAALRLVFAAALAPGMAEELLFRGIVLGSLLSRFGPGVAVLGAAALFGLFHVDPAHIAGAIPLGLYLGAVRIVTGSTLAAMLCHVVNNAAAILLAAHPGGFAIGVALWGAMCLVPSIWWMRRGWPTTSAEPVAAAESDG